MCSTIVYEKNMSGNRKIKAVSLFSGGGIGEMLLSKIGIYVVLANEIDTKRSSFYNAVYGEEINLCGDIRDKKIKSQIVNTIKKEKVALLIATPPCQGYSTAGKNKSELAMRKDTRNMLIFDLLEVIDSTNLDYILIENIPRFINLKYLFKGKRINIIEILNIKYDKKYNIEYEILNVKDYGVPQHRKRVVIKMYKKSLQWGWPKKEKEITVREAIGHLPSLESGESSEIPWHYAKEQNSRYVLAMKHTKEGVSALTNKKHYPKREDGKKIKGFHNTFRRISWNTPAWAITTNSGSIGSHNTVHPGRRKKNGTYSDARVLTPLELFLLFSIPKKNNIPHDIPETLIRDCVGEGVPPLFIKKVLQIIGKE